MYFVGVDLAWAGRTTTGVAVVDSDGALLHVCAVRDDDEHRTAVDPYVSDDCLVAIDAPLIVQNPTGSAPRDRAQPRLSQVRGRRPPGNTEKPEFTTVPARPADRGRSPSTGSAVDVRPARDRGVSASGHRRVVRSGEDPEVQEKPSRRAASSLLQLMTLIDGLDKASRGSGEPRVRWTAAAG